MTDHKAEKARIHDEWEREQIHKHDGAQHQPHKAEIGPVCPGYHNGQASSRWMDEDRCTTCDGYKPPITVPACDCEPTTWDDGSVSHEDDCPLYPWCPHEIAATCSMPCLCRCDGCMALTLGNQPTTSPAPSPREAEICTCGAWSDRNLAHPPGCPALEHIPPGKGRGGEGA